MTRTDYAWEMSNTPPSDPYQINPKRLAGMMRAFDHVASANYLRDEPRKLDLEALKKLTVEERERRERLEQREHPHRASFWYTFPPIKAIRRFRDSIRLRKHNREWSKNNPPMTIAEALSRVSDVINQPTSTHINVKRRSGRAHRDRED